MKNQITIRKIKNALRRGDKVYWVHEGYKVHWVDSELNEYSKLSYENGKALRVTCIENYFGSLLEKSELNKCFIVRRKCNT